ncbi:MAG: phage holin family protein [Gracilimonas sp.]|uniref:phage holin family protein n=1 Tax=Gracilimonas TaxID=649462 RepID=UPI001B22895D|nr:phage holin family protein [Gracilimonas sp.]MBO6586583.1 phage holin family protein [Gracilimonas sp.]MBO6615240.1 phage holin family protein [Gracilimonas sp.]
MEDVGSRIKQITRELKHYVETRIELSVLNIGDKVSYLIGQSIQQLFGYAILGLGLVFGLTALSIFLGDLLDKEWAGYAIVASPFIVLGLIFVVAKPKSIARKIQQQILAEFLDTLPNQQQDQEQLALKENEKKQTENNG